MSELHGVAWPLQGRTGLPPEHAWLRDAFPRGRWAEAAVPQTATHWLGMHDGFRRAGSHLTQVATAYQAGTLDLRGFHDRLLPPLSRFLQHLDGHHTIETDHYFPIFRRIEPRIAAGIDLLDRDHDTIHAHLAALAGRADLLHRAVGAGGLDAADHAARMAEALDAATPLLLRHLDDEEDIVIPLIALRGDPHVSNTGI